jgi:uncharacterized repeat protein (TIGR03803 family)
MEYIKILRLGAVVAALASAALATISCGGSGSSGQSASGNTTAPGANIRINVSWPQSTSRLIPDDSGSIQLAVTQGTTVIAQTCLAKGTDSYTFVNVPVGALTVTANAYSDSACSVAPPQATGSATVTMVAGVSQGIGVQLDGTVSTVTITPPTATIQVGTSGTLTGSAMNAANQIVPTAPSDWSWSCTPTAPLTAASGTGPVANITGANAGDTVCTMSVVQGTGGPVVSGTAAVTVNPAPTTVVSFNGTDGESPTSLMTDGKGNFYGITDQTTAGPNGTLFEYNTSSGVMTLGTFAGQTAGGQLVMDGSGDIFGITQNSSLSGELFEYNTTSGLTDLADGFSPGPSLAIDASDNLYGTIPAGGSSFSGAVFEYIPGTGLTGLASFTGANGSGPSVLIPGGAGIFYGVTPFGGANGAGVVYSLNGSTITVLHSFSGTDGSQPNGLVMDSSGDLFGTTLGGGANSTGTLFEIPAGGSFTVLASFGGDSPTGELVVGPSGAIYGSTLLGGTDPNGTVFAYNAFTGLSTVTTFNGTDGSGPTSLIADGSGDLFGLTSQGGANNDGTIFELPGVDKAFKGRSRTASGRVVATVREGRAH